MTAKQNALSEATGARDDAQRELATLPQDAETERAAASTALRTALTAMASARADLTAAQQARTAAQRVLNESIRKAADDGRKASRDLALARADAREATRTLTALGRKHRLALTRVRILGQAPGNVVEGDIIAAAMRELTRVQGEYSRLAARSGVQVPADEILFFPQTPVRVDSVAARSGDQLNGPLMTVSNTRLAIDSSLSPQEEDLVKRGDRVRIEEQDLRISISGRVASVADRPGTNSNFDPGPDVLRGDAVQRAGGARGGVGEAVDRRPEHAGRGARGAGQRAVGRRRWPRAGAGRPRLGPYRARLRAHGPARAGLRRGVAAQRGRAEGRRSRRRRHAGRRRGEGPDRVGRAADARGCEHDAERGHGFQRQRQRQRQRRWNGGGAAGSSNGSATSDPSTTTSTTTTPDEPPATAPDPDPDPTTTTGAGEGTFRGP